MGIKEEDFLKRLQSMFKIEAEEHINLISLSLIELEKNPKPERSAELVEIIFREAHSLKGAARSVDKNNIESICQVLENIFSEIKVKKVLLSADQYDLIHQATDIILEMVSGNETINGNEIIKQLRSFAKLKDTPGKKEKNIPYNKTNITKGNNAAVEIPVEETISDPGTVRISTNKLDPLFLQAEQMIQSKVAFTERTKDIKNIYDFIRYWKTDSRRLNAIYSARNEPEIKEIIDWHNERLNKLEEKAAAVSFNIKNDQYLLGKMIDEHLESTKSILMHPVSVITESIPRLVRDIARSQNKEVELLINEKEIEVDKRILQELKDPLIHLIRNSIDHGIQIPAEREKAGKPAKGTLNIDFRTIDGRQLEITVSDDGIGINADKVKSSAVKAGIITSNDTEKLNEQEAILLTLKSGISTSRIITNISGRGLGLAIVKEKVEKLGGSVLIESTPGKGAAFRILVPLTLSTFRGVLTKTGECMFFVPTSNVKLTGRVKTTDFKTVENRKTINYNNEIIAIVKLGDVLGIKDNSNIRVSSRENGPEVTGYEQIILLKHGDLQIGFIVDEILDEYQILVKELGKQLKYVRNISGAAVLGTGTIVPVINVSDLLQSALITIKNPKTITKVKEPEKTFKVLVAEDSITSRTLIRDILETAGYIVETAIDGAEGYIKAVEGEFDIIISDVDMPRMNGFELTTKIRNNKKLSELPIVLVTALESREDREHGIDVGANAYIIKSSFDQSNLLETIKRIL